MVLECALSPTLCTLLQWSLRKMSSQNSIGKNWYGQPQTPLLPQKHWEAGRKVRTSLSELRKLAMVYSKQVNKKIKKEAQKDHATALWHFCPACACPPSSRTGGLCSLVLEGAEQAWFVIMYVCLFRWNLSAGRPEDWHKTTVTALPVLELARGGKAVGIARKLH